jgi:hypothetical protein
VPGDFYGDIPGWLSALATVGALGLSSVVILRERQERKEHRRRERSAQARAVTWWSDLWETGDTGTWKAAIVIRNGSELPVYDVELPLNHDVFAADGKWTLGVVPPGEHRFTWKNDVHRPDMFEDEELDQEAAEWQAISHLGDLQLSAQFNGFAAHVSFTDANRVRWMRKADGALVEAKGHSEPPSQ